MKTPPAKELILLHSGRPEVGNMAIIKETNPQGHICETIGVITEITSSYIETKHQRDKAKYPDMGNHAYREIWIKHYYQLTNN